MIELNFQLEFRKVTGMLEERYSGIIALKKIMKAFVIFILIFLGASNFVLGSKESLPALKLGFYEFGENINSGLFWINDPDPSQCKIEVDKTEVIANGTDEALVTLKLFDSNGDSIDEGGDEVEIFIEKEGAITQLTSKDVGDGTYTATFVAGTKSERVLVRAKVDNKIIHDGKWIDILPGPADPAKSKIESRDEEIVADGISYTVLTVSLYDTNGNKLVDGGNKIDLSTDAGTISKVIDNFNGTYKARLTSSTKLENATISGKIDDKSINSNVVVKFGTGSPDPERSIITTDKNEIQANGTNSAIVTIKLFDKNGNPVQNGDATVKLEITPSSLAVLGSVSNNQDGTYSALITSKTEIGLLEVNGKVDSKPISDSTLIELIAGPANYFYSKIEAFMKEISADGISTAEINITLFDENDNPLKRGGDNVKLFTTSGTLDNAVAKDNFNGTYTSIIKAPNSIGEATITGELNGKEIEGFASVKFVDKDKIVDKCKSILTVGKDKITANGTSSSTVVLTIYDTKGDKINTGGLNVEFFTTLGNMGNVDDNSDGTYSSLLTSETKLGVAIITAKIDGEYLCGNAHVEFVVGDVDPQKCTITASKAEIPADNKSESLITVLLKDEFANPYSVGGETVELFSSEGVIKQNAKDNNDGSYEENLVSSLENVTAIVTAKVNGLNITSSTNVKFVPKVLPDPTKSTVSAKEIEIKANGQSTTEITVSLKDKDGNIIKAGDFEVLLSTTKGSITFDPVDNKNGTYTGVLTSSKQVEKATISAKVNGVNIENTAEVNFVKPEIDLAKSTITPKETKIIADGISYTTVLVRLVDLDGIPLTIGGDDVKLFTTNGSISSKPVDNNDGTYTGTLTSVNQIGSATVSGKVNDKDIASKPVVEFVAGDPSPLKTTITADKKQILYNGVGKATITVQLRDALGNKVNKGGYKVDLVASAGNLSDVKDNDDGTHTAILTSSDKEETSLIGGALENTPILSNTEVEFVKDIGIDLALCKILAKDSVILADGVDDTPITVTLFDSNGEQLENGGDKVELFASAGELSNVKDNNDGTYTALLTSSKVEETSKIIAKVNDQEISEFEIVYFVKEFTADPKTTRISSDKPKIFADGTSMAKITVTLFDLNGSKVTNGKYKVVIDNGGIGTLGPLNNNQNGTYTATLTSSNKKETCVITGTLEGEPIVDTETVEFVTEVVADPSLTQIDAAERKILADGTSETEVIVQVYDIKGAKKTVGGDKVELFSSAGILKSTSPKDNNDGTYTTQLISDNSPGMAIIGGVINGDTIYDADKVFFVDKIISADPKKCVITSQHPQLPADGKSFSVITAVLYDESGQQLDSGGDEVILETNLGNLKLSEAGDNGDGTYTDTLYSVEKEGKAKVTGKVNGVDIDDFVEVYFGFDVVMVDAVQCKIIAKPSKIKADGKSTAEIIIRLYGTDGKELKTGGHLVKMNPPSGGSYDNKDGIAKDNGDGTYTIILTSSTKVEKVIIKGTVAGNKIGDSAEIEFFKDVIADPKLSSIDVDKNELLADGKSTAQITVTLYDTNGDQITIDDNLVELELTPSKLGSIGSISFKDGVYIAEFTSGNEPGEVVITGTVNGDIIASNEKIELIEENGGEVIVPEGFSPNGDQINDLLVIPGIIAYPQSKFVVFNRWGSKVYSASGYKNDWDGKSSFPGFGSSSLPNGTYYYVLDLGNGNDLMKGYFYIGR